MILASGVYHLYFKTESQDNRASGEKECTWWPFLNDFSSPHKCCTAITRKPIKTLKALVISCLIYPRSMVQMNFHFKTGFLASVGMAFKFLVQKLRLFAFWINLHGGLSWGDSPLFGKLKISLSVSPRVETI